jgi:YceI-like domain
MAGAARCGHRHRRHRGPVWPHHCGPRWSLRRGRTGHRYLHREHRRSRHDPQARTGLVNGAGSVDLGRLVLSQIGAAALPTPGTWQIDPTHSTVATTAVHVGFAKIHGRFRKFSGTLTVAHPMELSSVDVIIEAASIDTDNPDRDAHLRSPDFLHVQAFPQIRYTGHRLTLLGPDTCNSMAGSP